METHNSTQTDQKLVSSEQLETFGDTDHFQVNLLKEELAVQKGQRRAGEVRIEKRIIEEQVQVPITLRREEIFLTRSKPDAPDSPPVMGEMPKDMASASAKPAFEEETLTFVLYEEIPLVSKITRVSGTVEVSKRILSEEKTITDTVRREEAEVDKGTTGRVTVTGVPMGSGSAG